MIKNLLLVVMVVTLIVSGCKPKENDPVAGKGGNATLKVFTAHHTRLIDDAKVYIKYNATSIPSNALYQDTLVNATVFDDSLQLIKPADTAFATFTQLKPGNYFIFGYGYDASIGEDVYGGIPFVITTEKEYKILCPVSEDH